LCSDVLRLASALPPIFQQRQPFPTDNRPLSGEEWRLKLVERLMSLPSPVANGAAQLWGMGDEVAVDVLMTLSASPSLMPKSIPSVLDIIHMAFEKPPSIIEPVNRRPQAATFLLQYLNSTTSDDTIKERITKETAFVQSSTASSAATSAPQ
jgi:hypothetical protein